MPSKKSKAKRSGFQKETKHLKIENLEDRSMLSAMSLGQTGDAVSVGELKLDFDEYHQSRIIVKLEDGLEGKKSLKVGQDRIKLGKHIDSDSGYRQVNLPEDMSVEQAIRKFSRKRMVESAELDFKVNITGSPDDPSFSDLWGLHNTGQTGGTTDADIDALEAWDITIGSSSTIVAVIDTGVDYTHPDLAGNMWINTDEIAGNGIDDDGNGYVDDIHGYDFYDNDGDPMDTGGHGTHVAGTIGAQGDNGIGIVGVNWEVQIMALRFLGPQGGYTSDAIAALNYAVDNGATISNNSWGGGGFSSSLYSAIQNARSNGHIFVAAAGNDYGNDNDSNPHYPSNYDLDNVISVASTTSTDSLSDFSNIGQTTVDLAAPGSGIYSTLPGNSYGTYSGTSMATPHVSGVVALIKSHFPELSYSEVIDKIYSTVDVLPSLAGKMVTGGRLNAAAAVAGQSPGIIVTPASGLETSESGATATFSVSLRSAPTANVTIGLNSTDTTEGTVSTSQLTFTPSNWDQSQIVTVTGQDDNQIDGNIAFTINLAPAVSLDSDYNGLDPSNVEVINKDDEKAPIDFYFSVGNDGVQVGGLLVDNEDIVAKTKNGDYEILFDGSDLGLSPLTIDAFSVISDDTILLSFSVAATFSDLGTVDDSDILQFVGDFGSNTSGTLSFFFDASDVGLTTSGEDIDAIKLIDENTLLVSTAGSYSVPNASGNDEDLILFSANSFGASTSGSWSPYFDGSDVGLSTSSSEDIDAVAIDGSGNILLSTRGNFSVPGVAGADEDIFLFSPSSLGSNTSGTFDSELFFDGSLAGISGTDIFAIDFPLIANDKPIAGNDSYTIDEDNVLVVGAPGVLANDTDPEGSDLTAALVSGPSSGELTLNTDGSFTYTPDENFFGTDSFQYRANDGATNSDAATVTITVNGVNDAPVAVADSYSTNEDETLDVPVESGVLDNDNDVDGDTLSAVLVSGPSNGTLSLNSNGSFSYSPTAGFAGTDSFSYKNNDGALDSNTVTVEIEVVAKNDKPIAGNDSYTIDEDNVLVVGAPGVLANDTDPEGSDLTAALVSGPSSGELTLNTDGSFTYTPDENFFGTDSFQYRANDGATNSDAATVTITVNGVNDAPVAVADSYSTNEDETLDVPVESGVLDNDNDVDGDTLSAVLVSGPSNGTLSLNSNGSFSYSPTAGFAGTDSFSYKNNDGALDSNTVTVEIEVVAQSGTKFFVVDTSTDNTFEYDATGTLVENYGLYGSTPRGITTTADGTRAWVIDNNDYVYMYDDSGTLLGVWYASGLSRPEGIALDGNDLLIVDRGIDAVLRYTGAASRISGSQAYDSGFYLVSSNGNARGITTDGYNIWVVNDNRGLDRIYRYSDDALYYGYWQIDAGNTRPRGITIDPNDVNHIWVVDSSSDAIYEYRNSVARAAGTYAADQAYLLNASNYNPQGIADPISFEVTTEIDLIESDHLGPTDHAGQSNLYQDSQKINRIKDHEKSSLDSYFMDNLTAHLPSNSNPLAHQVKDRTAVNPETAFYEEFAETDPAFSDIDPIDAMIEDVALARHSLNHLSLIRLTNIFN